MSRGDGGVITRGFATLCFAMFLGNVSYSIFIPLIPELFNTRQPGGAARFGFVQSSANFVGLMAGLILGRMSDAYGARKMLILCQIAAVCGAILLRARIAGAVMVIAALGITFRNSERQASRMLAKAYVVNTELYANRPARLAMLMSLMSLGFAGGSSLAGVLSLSPPVALTCAVGLAAVGLTVSVFGLEEPLKVFKNEDKSLNKVKSHQHFVQAMKSLVRGVQSSFAMLVKVLKSDSRMRTMLLVRLLTTLAFHTFVSMFTPYATTRFRWSRQQLGYCLTFIGLCFALVNGLVVPSLTRLATPRTLILVSLWALVIARMCFSLATPTRVPCASALELRPLHTSQDSSTSSSSSSGSGDVLDSTSGYFCAACPSGFFSEPNPVLSSDDSSASCVQSIVPLMVLAQVCVAVGGGLLQTLMAAQLSVLAEPAGCVGLILGVSEAIKSASGVLAPAFSGTILEVYGEGAPAATAALFTLFACLVMHMSPAGGQQIASNEKKKD